MAYLAMAYAAAEATHFKDAMRQREFSSGIPAVHEQEEKLADDAEMKLRDTIENSAEDFDEVVYGAALKKQASTDDMFASFRALNKAAAAAEGFVDGKNNPQWRSEEDRIERRKHKTRGGKAVQKRRLEQLLAASSSGTPSFCEPHDGTRKARRLVSMENINKFDDAYKKARGMM